MNTELSAEELKRRIEILRNQNFYKGKSYFPEKKSKSIEERFEDCVEQIKEYGWPDFQYLLYGMDVKSREECHSYVNAMEFVNRRNYLNFERNHFNSCCILRNKFYFGIYANALGLKTPENVLFIEKGKIMSIEHRFETIPFVKMLSLCNDCFCKSIDGENGEGVYHIQVQGGSLLVNSEQYSEDKFWKLLGDGRFLVQNKIYQHKDMERLYPLSINTLRVVTVRSLKDGEIKVWPSMLRMGAGGNHIDNASAGGVVVNIYPESGALSKEGYKYAKFGGRYTEHPETHVEFASFKIPYFEEVKREAIYFHSMLKDIHSIGWDIAITDNGPAFIEGNDDWSIVQSQLSGGVRELYNEFFF